MRRRPGPAVVVGLVVGALLAERAARAAEPTTAACLAASESSLALRRQHKLREARAQLLICSAASCPGDVRDECLRGVSEINAAMPKIVFEPKDAAGNDVVAVSVKMDGSRLAERLDGSALSIDPGEHSFTFEVAGQPSVEKRFMIHEGEKDRHERIVFGGPALTTAPKPSPGPVAGLGSPEGEPPARDESGSHLGTQRILAIVAAGVGAAGLGIGIGYGLSARSKRDHARDICPANPCMTTDGATAWSDAGTAGDVATVGFIVGGVGLAASAVLWFTAKPGQADAQARTKDGTQIGFGLGTLLVRGTW